MNSRLLLLLLLLIPQLSFSQTSGEVLRRVLIEQGNPEYDSCRVTLLPSAREKYADMFSVIRKAERFVHLEYFIFRHDSIGGELINLLREKVEQGVEVRLLIDAYGNWKASDPITEEQMDSIRQLGIHFAVFDPLRFPWIPNMLHRDHRKIVVVDGLYAWTGGMNVADYYIHGTKQTGAWHDLHARFEGPVVDEFGNIFIRIWNKTTGESLAPRQYRATREPETYGSSVVSIVNREPKVSNRQIRQSLVAALKTAKQEVCIINPYVTNTHSVRRAMKQALRRGIRMKIMVSANSDNKIVPEVIGIQMKKMMRRGAEVYYFEGGFHHSKIMTVDNEIGIIGTANLDGRSLRYDYEVNAVVFDPQVTTELNEIFRRSALQSQILTPKNFKQRFSLKRRFVGRMFQPIKGLL